MRLATRLLVVAALAGAVGFGLTLRDAGGAPAPAAAPTPAAAVPRLVDLGAGRCVPCKAMAPILEELRAEHAGRLEIRFIDVWQDPAAAEPYRIQMIPTQIFYGADGRELSRHEGFMSKADILARWRSHGVAP